jgi:hypothetical protein
MNAESSWKEVIIAVVSVRSSINGTFLNGVMEFSQSVGRDLHPGPPKYDTEC